jgi:hypothetical protein
MKGSTGIMLLKVIRHLFGILRSIEQWVMLESGTAAASAHREDRR